MVDYEKCMKNILYATGPKVSLQLALIVLHLYNEGGAVTTRYLADEFNSSTAGILHIVHRLQRAKLLEEKGTAPIRADHPREFTTYGLTDRAIDILESDDLFGYEDIVGCQFPS